MFLRLKERMMAEENDNWNMLDLDVNEEKNDVRIDITAVCQTLKFALKAETRK